MSKKPAAPKMPSIIDKIEADLEYRLPQSHKPLSTIVLSREQAEMLLQEINELTGQLRGKAI